MGRLWLALVVVTGCGRFGFDEANTSPGVDAPPTSNVARVTVQYNGLDGGTVVGPDGFTCVGQTCTLEVVPGTTVTLRGLAPSGSWFAGWTGPCGGNFDCEFQADTDVTVGADFSATPNRIFVTSTTTDGAFGGVSAADAICAARATAANLNGTFVAYLSDATINAASRVGTSRGSIRVDGAPFADAPTAFSSGNIIFPPRTDEYGNDVGSVQVFTGTSGGATSASRCLDWTTNAGAENGAMIQSVYGSDSMFASNRACSSQGHLLCVEIGRAVPVTIHPDTGRLAFMAKTGWTPGGGRADADAHCASEAAAAGLSGTFLAAVATTTESIASRFATDAIYRRVDGVRLLRSPGMFVSDWLDASPELDQLGASVSSDVWTGANRFNQVAASGADNCNDWTDGTSALDGIQHWSTSTDLRSPAKKDPCDLAVALLCLER